MKTLKIFFLLAVVSYATILKAQNANCTSANVRSNLIAFNTSTNGSTWTVKWNTSLAIDTWFGLRLRSSSEIISLKLPNNNLTGTLPIALTRLCPFIDSLDLSRNTIGGTIPLTIGDLWNLSYLNLRGNRLAGAIPASIGNLKVLRALDLGNNALTTMPTQIGSLYYNDVDVGIFSTILSIRLDSNQIGGSIPRLDTLTNLRILDLSHNRLSGELLMSFNNMRNLALLDVSNNDLSILNSRFWSNINSTNSIFVDFSNNRFTFEDLLPNMPLVNRTKAYTYAPQKDLCTPQTHSLDIGDDFTLDIKIDPNLRTNEYRWYKDGKLIDKTSVNSLTLRNLTACAAGMYECRVTNPSVPNLTLYCRDQSLQVSAPPCEKDLNIVVAPNPATSRVTIRLKGLAYEGRFLRLYNAVGHLIRAQELTEPEMLIDGVSFDMTLWSRGLYFLSLHTEGGQIVGTNRFLKL